MAKGPISDLNDQLFVLLEQLNILEIADNAPSFGDFGNKRTVKLLLSEARNFAVKEVLPTNKIGDRVGAQFKNGEVVMPKEFKKLYENMVDAGFLAMTEDTDYGGEGMPHVLAIACQEWFTGANLAFMLYPGLAREVGKLLEKHGNVKSLSNETVKSLIKGLYGGVYGGTMCLTEPQAGSDVGAVETTAVENDDGTYTITGSKIFITNGEHNLTHNILHPVLARVKDAPAGTKGISLFLVPKLIGGKFNNVKCTGIEEKMGIHGNATCSMAFDGAEGYLIGEENKGMSIMFSLMNEARIMVASQGLGAASAAYQYALEYAKTRIQGRRIEDVADHSATPVAIIEHPDVRRQLMYMKSHVEGMRSLLYWVVFCMDRAEEADELGNDQDKEKYSSFVDLLTSLLKGVLTDRAVKVCNQAMQVFGGVGYTKEYPVEQLLRDVRITPIYEGTNGIQAMDFLFRQIPAKDGKPIMALITEIKETIAYIGLREVGELGDMLDEATGIIMNLLFTKPDVPAGYANVAMDAIGDLLIAWQLLWRCENGSSKQIYVMKYFMKNVLPANMALLRELYSPDRSHLVIDL